MDRWNPNPVGIQGLNWKPGETGDFIILKWHPNSFRKHLNWRLRQNKNRKGEGRGFEVCQTDWLAEDNIEDFGKEIYQCKANKKKKICDTLNPQFKSGAVCLAASFQMLCHLHTLPTHHEPSHSYFVFLSCLLRCRWRERERESACSGCVLFGSRICICLRLVRTPGHGVLHADSI